MKKIKWNILIITSIMCILPISLGVVLWDRLPDTMAIHFDINNNPDNFASKEFTVFGLPFIMVLLQIICCVINDLELDRKKGINKIGGIAKWIIPIASIVLQVATIGFSLGWLTDIRVVASVLVGVILIVTGVCMSKLDYVKNYKLSPDKARKINKFIGIETIILGVLFLISTLLPPIATVICVVLLIPFTIIAAVYGIKESKKN